MNDRTIRDNKLVHEYIELISQNIKQIVKFANLQHKLQLEKQLQELDAWRLALENGDLQEFDIQNHFRSVSMLGSVIDETNAKESIEYREGGHHEILLENYSRAQELVYKITNPGVLAKRMASKAVSKVDDDSPMPVFVISSWRSGSTLLMSILDAHKNLTSLPEVNFLGSFLKVEPNHTSSYQPTLFKERPPIINAVNDLRGLGITDDQFYQQFSIFIDSLASIYVSKKGGKRWVLKEAINLGSLSLIDIIFGYNARFVWLVRHGLDVVNSYIERYEQRGVQNADLSLYAHDWVEANRLFNELHERIPDRCLKVRYEDLTQNPESEVKRVLNHIGEPWDENIFNNMKESSNQLGGDHKYSSSGGKIKASRVGHWDAWPAAYVRQFGNIVNPMLEILGYDIIQE